MFVRRLSVIATLFPSVVAAQRDAGQVPAYQHPVFHSDSIDVTAVSVSPNGKWIAFDGVVHGHSSIWAVSATGGPARRLTDGTHNDRQPVWFPSGERVAFATDRVNGVMTVGFDNQSGQPVGALKRISMEPVEFFDVSPDGKRIAYIVSPGARGNYRLRVAPASGGAAKTVHESADRLRFVNFDKDGKSVYSSFAPGVSLRDPGVLRIALEPNASGAYPTSTLPYRGGTLVLPTSNRIVTNLRNQFLVLSMSGDTIATVGRAASPIFKSFSPDGQTMYQASSQVDATVRVVNTETGGVSAISSPRSRGYFYPIGWTTDNRVAFGGGPRDTLYLANPGKTPVPVRTDPANRLEGWGSASVAATGISGDGRSLFVRGPNARGPYIFHFDLQTRRVTELTHQAIPGGVQISGWSHSGEIHFFEKTERGVDVKAIRPGEPARTMAVLPSEVAGTIVSLIRDRIVYCKQVGDSTILYSVKGSEAPRGFASVAGSLAKPVASPDGNWLAATASIGSGSAAPEQRVVFLHLGADGLPDRAPRFVATDVMWDLEWTPDSRSVIGLEELGSSSSTRIRRIPVDPAESPSVIGPTNLTFWDAFLSPDGKNVAIPAERFSGSTIWAFDLTNARARR